MVDRNEPECESSDFKQFLFLPTVSDILNTIPVLLLEDTVIPCVQSWTLVLSYRLANQLICAVTGLVKKELHFTGTSIISILNQLLKI